MCVGLPHFSALLPFVNDLRAFHFASNTLAFEISRSLPPLFFFPQFPTLLHVISLTNPAPSPGLNILVNAVSTFVTPLFP